MTMHITPEEFRFMIEDITSDLIQMLIEREGYTLPQAVDTIYKSDTMQPTYAPKQPSTTNLPAISTSI